MPYIGSEEASLYYEDHGSGEPLVLVTGFGMDTRAWNEQLEPYARYFRVLLLELRGAGRSGVPEPGYGIADMAEDVVRLMDTLDLERIHFGGFSLGGAIGAELAIAHSPRLRSLALHSTWEASERYPHMQRWNDVRRRIMMGGDAEANFGSRIASFFSPQFINRNPERIEAWIEQQRTAPHPVTPEGVEGHAIAMRNHDVRGRLDRISVPTLITVGSQDRTTIPEAARYLHQHIENSELVLFDGAAHCTKYEVPAEFTTVTLGFLMKHAGR